MMNFEEQYRKQFKDQASSGDLNADALWSKVVNEIDSKGVADISARKLFTSLGLIGLLFVSGMYLWMYEAISTQNQALEVLSYETKLNSTLYTTVDNLNSNTSFYPSSIDKLSSSNSESEFQDATKNSLHSIDQVNDKLESNQDFPNTKKKESYSLNENNADDINAQNHMTSEDRSSDKSSLSVTGTNTKEIQGNVAEVASKEEAKSMTEGVGRSDLEVKVEFRDSDPIPSSENQDIVVQQAGKHGEPWSNYSFYSEDQTRSTQKEVGKINSGAFNLLAPISFSFNRNLNYGLIDYERSEKQESYYGDNSLIPSELSFLAGSVLYDNTFKAGDNPSSPLLKDQLASATQLDWGISGSMRATWKSKGLLRFSLGLDYSQLRTIYDKVSVSQTTVSEDGRIIGLGTDSLGNIVPLYGSLDYNAIQTRTVLHHNRFKMFTIPIEIGLEKRFDRLSMGLHLGLGYSHILSQSGRTLDAEGNLVYFDVGDSALPYKNSYLSYNCRAQFGFRIHERLDMRFEPGLRLLPSHESPLQGIKLSSKAYSLNFGVAYMLK